MLTHINNPHKRRAGRSTSRTTIDWTSISQVQSSSSLCDCVPAGMMLTLPSPAVQLMGRPYMDCKGKWKKIRAFNMKKGNFCWLQSSHCARAPFDNLPSSDLQAPSRRRRTGT